MPFIGNQPTSGRFIELDSLTASATDEYTLQLNSANFEPESVNNLLVSINGVIQGSSTMSLNGAVLTVGATLSSSDTIDFVRVFGNVGTVSTPTDGSVTANKIGSGAVDLTSKVSGVLPVANGGTGMSTAMADQWRKTTDTSGTLGPITDLERVDTAGQGTIGPAMSVSSGIFTFPTTGIYLVRATFAHTDSGSSSRYISGQIQVTTDNSNYVSIAETYQELYHINSSTYSQSSTESLVNVTDTSNVKVKFNVIPVASSTITRGLSTANYTHFTFIRLGA